MVISKGKQRGRNSAPGCLFIWMERPVYAEGKEEMEEEYFKGKEGYAMA